MSSKWFGMSSRHNKQENSRTNGDEISNVSDKKGDFMAPSMTQPTEKTPVQSSRSVPSFQVQLLPVEDIYRAAGIITPTKGYSVSKVVEMLRSEHIRGLSPEMKRAAVLMALDAAGVPLAQVQQDAKARKEALDSYEAAQTEQVDAEWARKAEEVSQIQAELESIKAHYQARITRNLEGVTREKATFGTWQTMKQQEVESMVEAAELCSKAMNTRPAPDPPKPPEAVRPRQGATCKSSAVERLEPLSFDVRIVCEQFVISRMVRRRIERPVLDTARCTWPPPSAALH